MQEQESKRVFVGCASDDAVMARAEFVNSALRSANCVPLTWWTTDAFALGLSLLHNIQNIPSRISGAIFLATPDDKITCRRPELADSCKELLVPRTNVMLELGHFMGVLGPSNVAICRYRECSLPSDLDGVTYIDMGRFEERPPDEVTGRETNAKARGQGPEERIRDWAAHLPYAAGLAVSRVVQGYTGRWEIFGKYSKWCDHQLVEASGDRAELTGYADLLVPSGGAGGPGVVHGQLTVELQTLGSYAEYRVTSLMNNINCNQAGALSFETEIFSYQRLYPRTPSDRAADDAFDRELIGYPRHSWSLRPSATDVGLLVGGFMLPDHRSAADVEARKTFL
jgi:hypothetical protein